MESNEMPESTAISLWLVGKLLVSWPLLPLLILAETILYLSTTYVADPFKKPEVALQEQEEGTVHVMNGKMAVGFGGFASIGLLIMYFFPNFIIYFSLIIFALGSYYSMRQVLNSIFHKIPGLKYSHAGILSNGCAITLTILWGITRNSESVWILHDILGGCLISLILQTLKLPTLRITALLLASAFIYDIFWVFISSRLTSDGKSVMESAATGAYASVNETMPMLLRVPIRLWDDKHKGQFAILGFGDIVIPGLAGVLLCEMDGKLGVLAKKKRKSCDSYITPSYHTIFAIGYAFGLELTFAAMLVSNRGQPALLYLVPCILLPVIFVAWRRRELVDLWTGEIRGYSAIDTNEDRQPSATDIENAFVE